MQTSSHRPLAVVTGGTSALGRELARQCIAHGFDVVLIAASPGVHETARQLGADVAQVYSQRHDLATWDGVESAWREIQSLERPIDALLLVAVDGAGELQEQLRLVRRNCDAVVHFAQRALPAMTARAHGRVLLTVSPSAEPVQAAMRAFTLAFAGGLRASGGGVTITTVQPREETPALVARQAFAALLRGKAHVYAGSWRSRVRAWWASLFPEASRANGRLLRAP